MNMQELAQKAKAASTQLALLTSAQKNAALAAMAHAVETRAQELYAANRLDVQEAQEAAQRGTLKPALLARLKLDENKLHAVTHGMRELMALPDPVGQVLAATELDDGLTLKKISCPLGVLLVIFEARPDVLPQIAALAVKSGNAVILKGGREAVRTNEAFLKILQEALAALPGGWPENALNFVSSRQEAAELLQQDGLIDLVIPRGGNALVKYVKENTNIPVLGHADGVCHIYIAPDAAPEMALRVCVDAKTQYPAACNTVETLLVDEAWPQENVNRLLAALQGAGVKIHALESQKTRFPGCIYTPELNWHTEYGSLDISVCSIPQVQQAVRHINQWGSHHTDAILTQDEARAQYFLSAVDSAGVYWNASTRFADGYRYGFGAEVGISTAKTHARGPVGLVGLTIYKYRLCGNGQVVADYVGPHAKPFTHKNLLKEAK